MSVTDADFGVKLCKVLNLDPKKTVNIRIINNINDAVKVQVDQLLMNDEATEVLKLMAEYELIEKPKA